jgi:cytochrome c oxidase subunit III
LLLGSLFTYLQVCEYLAAPFSIQDGYYPAVFFSLTGLHGFHVLLGSIILICMLLRLLLRVGFRSRRLHYTCGA